MTKKLFWQDPYQTQLDTRITRVDGNDATVAETIFCACAGGQESDQGTIGGQRVVRARKQAEEIFYTLEEGHGLEVGRIQLKRDNIGKGKERIEVTVWP